MLVEHGRLVLAMDVERWFRAVTQIRGLRFVALDNEIAVKSVALVDFHKDLADRIIVATARELSASVVTKDEKIRGYPRVKTVW
jgi:PIN domain nuclease of toxin-antitoxin system